MHVPLTATSAFFLCLQRRKPLARALRRRDVNPLQRAVVLHGSVPAPVPDVPGLGCVCSRRELGRLYVLE
jgi:hypothetical protein